MQYNNDSANEKPVDVNKVKEIEEKKKTEIVEKKLDERLNKFEKDLDKVLSFKRDQIRSIAKKINIKKR